MPIRVNSTRKNEARDQAPPSQALAAGAPAMDFTQVPVVKSDLPFNLPPPPTGWEQLPAGLSLCMIVKNEERFLPMCLNSVAGVVDEINIVDTGSSDRTLEIAKQYGARVKHIEWQNDFAWARNHALEMATKRWILVLDADEELTADSVDALMAIKSAPAFLTGVWLRCISLADDYKGTGAMSSAIIRIVPTHPRIRYRSPIHEFLTLDDRFEGCSAVLAPVRIIHHGYTKEMIKERGKGKRNLAIVKAAAEADPTDLFHCSNLGLTAYISGEIELARSSLEKMIEMADATNRTAGFIPNSMIMLADLYSEQLHNHERAEALCRDCLKKTPNYTNAHFMLGKALQRMERYPEALEAFQASIDDEKFLSQQFVADDEIPIWKAPAEIATTYAKMGEYQKSLDWYDRALANREGVQPVLLNRARALEMLNRHSEARSAFRHAFEQFQDDDTAVFYVNYLLRRNEHQEALAVMEQALPIVSDRCKVSLLSTASTVAARMGDNRAAVEYLERGRAISPGNALILATLEKFYLERNDRTSLDALHSAELDAPCIDADDFARRSSRWFALGDFDHARAIGCEGLAKSPEHATLLYNIALAEVRLNEKAAAIERLSRVTQASTDVFLNATYLRAVLLAECERRDEALAALDALLKVAPSQLDAVILRAKLLDAGGATPEAELALLGVFDVDRKRIGMELAAIYVRTGRMREAADIADRALA